MRLRQRSRVLLPQPDGPMSAVICLLAIDMLIPVTAGFPPYATPTSTSSKTFSCAGAVPVSSLRCEPSVICTRCPSVRCSAVSSSLACIGSPFPLVAAAQVDRCGIHDEQDHQQHDDRGGRKHVEFLLRT